MLSGKKKSFLAMNSISSSPKLFSKFDLIEADSSFWREPDRKFGDGMMAKKVSPSGSSWDAQAIPWYSMDVRWPCCQEPRTPMDLRVVCMWVCSLAEEPCWRRERQDDAGKVGSELGMVVAEMRHRMT